MDGFEKVGSGALGWSEVEGFEGVEGEVGAADDDPLGEVEELGGAVPAWEVEEGVGSGDGEEFDFGVLLLQGCEGVDGVVGTVVGAGGVEGGGGEARGFEMRVRFGTGEGDHGEAVGVGGLGAGGLEGLAGGGGEEDLGEGEGVGGGTADGHVAAVWGVERSAEERDARFTAEGDAGWGLGWSHGGGVGSPPP